MIVFVDYEHEDGRTAPFGERMMAARTRITYRLEDLAGKPCHLVRWDRVTPALLDRLGAEAVFISGNSVDPARYDPLSLEPLHEIIVDSQRPIFGFCGGFQCIAQALGVELRPITVNETTPDDRLRPFGQGRQGEAGYHTIDIHTEHPLVDGIENEPVVRHAHHLEVPAPPRGFVNLASTPITDVQMAVDDERRMAGTQFHPEYWTDEHPAGRRMIQNFLHWSGVID